MKILGYVILLLLMKGALFASNPVFRRQRRL